MISAIICHAIADLRYAQKLCEDLKVLSIKIWLESDISYEETENAIQKSSVLLVLLSRGSIANQSYISERLRLSLGKYYKNGGKILAIPIRLDDTKIPSTGIGRIHWVDMFPRWSEGVDKIFDVIKGIDKIIKENERIKRKIDEATHGLPKIEEVVGLTPVIIDITPLSSSFVHAHQGNGAIKSHEYLIKRESYNKANSDDGKSRMTDPAAALAHG